MLIRTEDVRCSCSESSSPLLYLTKKVCDLRVTAFLCPDARSASVVVFDTNIRAIVGKHACNLQVSVGGGKHQGRSVQLVLDVGVCAACEEQIHHVRAVGQRGAHKSS